MSNLSCGIIGLPNVGKSTLFQALTNCSASAENYPFCTIAPNIGSIEIADPRLQQLGRLFHSARILPAKMQLTDIAGLVKGAAQGEGLGNQFLAHIRETDALLHLVRCFDAPQISHVSARIDPLADLEVIELELILADLQAAQKAAHKLSNNPPLRALLQRVIAHLDSQRPIRLLPLSQQQRKLLQPYPFLTQKNIIFVANTSEHPLSASEQARVDRVADYARQQGCVMIPLCAQLERELAALEEQDAQQYLSAIGLSTTARQRLISASFASLNLITFLTAGKKESRAWPIRRGTWAQQAAAKIHSDIERGLVRVEVIPYAEMIACGGRAQAKEAGKARLEGKEYVVQDGDVLLFFHHHA